MAIQSPHVSPDVDRDQQRSDRLAGHRDLIATAQMLRDEAADTRARSHETLVRARRALAACRERMVHLRAVRSVRVAAPGG